MANDILAYHRETNHSPASVRRRHGRGLDWGNEPHPFKEYARLPAVELPRPASVLPVSLFNALRKGVRRRPAPPFGTSELAHLLYYSAGITRVRTLGGQPFYFRAYASAGALYPIEVYVVTAGLAGLKTGVYHFHPQRFVLRPLRQGDYRPALFDASAGEARVGEAPVTVILTGIYWRTTWKYEARGYRHLYWDSGMLLANLLTLASARGIAAKVVLGFEDASVDRLLGLDGEREVSLALIPLGEGVPVAGPEPPLAQLALVAAPLSAHEVDYPAIRAAHAATRLSTQAAVLAWRAPRPRLRRRAPPGAGAGMPFTPATAGPPDSVERVILRRGSTRRFARVPVSWTALSTILEAATLRAVPTDLAGGRSRIITHFLTIHAVETLPSGAYVMEDSRLHLLREGDFRRQAGHLCLDQPLAADAAAVIFLMADLQRTIGGLGERAYRAAQLEAGILAGRMYLAAYAHRLGATGLTFYDAEVTAFFSPSAASAEPMLVMAVGRDVRRFGDAESAESIVLPA